jgi:hypothetical protein
MDKKDKSDLISEVGIGVSFSSFMTAVVFFFIGLLLTGKLELQFRLRVPLILLFLSAFGFLYATLIYANASGEQARRGEKVFDKQVSAGNILSEYLGLYCLVFSLPITVLGYSPDKILAVILLIIDCAGFYIYHKLGYSIFERYLGKNDMRYLMPLVCIILAFQIGAFIFFYIEAFIPYYIMSGLLMLTIFSLIYYSFKNDESVKKKN